MREHRSAAEERSAIDIIRRLLPKAGVGQMREHRSAAEERSAIDIIRRLLPKAGAA